MPLFTYKAVNDKKAVIEDTVYAANKDDAAASLKGQGLQVLKIKPASTGSREIFARSVSVAEKAMFCRFLATMLRAGLSLPEALEIIKQESTSRRLQTVIADAVFQVRKGRQVSDVLREYPQDFDSVFLTIVKAGEDAGNLDQAFDYLAQQLLASHELSQKVRGSLMYPAVIVLAMIGVGNVIVLFVLPRVSDAFSKMSLDIPLVTRLLFDFGNFVGGNIALVVGVMVLAAIIIFLLFVTPATRRAIVGAVLRIPAIRVIVNHIDVSRFSRTLSSLLKSGVSVVEALDVSAESLSQPKLRAQAKLFGKGVEKGESLSQVLSNSKGVFPVTMIQTIKAGEKTGTLDTVLIEMAEFYEREVDHSLKRFTSLLEPILMLAVGVGVGAMVIVIIAPIYSIIGGLQSSIGR